MHNGDGWIIVIFWFSKSESLWHSVPSCLGVVTGPASGHPGLFGERVKGHQPAIGDHQHPPLPAWPPLAGEDSDEGPEVFGESLARPGYSSYGATILSWMTSAVKDGDRADFQITLRSMRWGSRYFRVEQSSVSPLSGQTRKQWRVSGRRWHFWSQISVACGASLRWQRSSTTLASVTWPRTICHRYPSRTTV